jgi:uncharacterized protein (DUF305 family)
MRQFGIFSMTLVVLLTGTMLLDGCNRADRNIGMENDNQVEGSAAVRGTNEEANRDLAEYTKDEQELMQKYLGNADANYDDRFIKLMVAHQQGAVEMARDAQQKAQHPELKRIAQQIADSQQKEITQLQTWQKQWYGGDQATNTQ